MAAVLAQDGAVLDATELRSFCRDRLAGYKVPREFYQLDDLPRSMLGKVLRKQVKESLPDATPLA